VWVAGDFPDNCNTLTRVSQFRVRAVICHSPFTLFEGICNQLSQDDNILDDDNAFFVYMGEGGDRVPDDVIHARVHPTVTVLPFRAFYKRAKLEKVELCEGLREIGEEAFKECKLLKEIKTPSTVTTIRSRAFSTCSALTNVELNEGLLEIGDHAFHGSKWTLNIPTSIRTIGEKGISNTDVITLHLPDAIHSCEFSNFRSPPLVVTIPFGMFECCKNQFSVEIPEHVILIEYEAFVHCNNLRNLALSQETVLRGNVFWDCTDLLQVWRRPWPFFICTEEQI
jgi:hypothetical protein